MTTILIADDDLELCQLLQEYLQLEGLEVTCVHDGEAAVTTALNHQPDLLVLDIMLPRLPGLEALKQIREQSALPVVMLTARGDDMDRILGLELGADDYLPKPCNPRELVARIRAVLRRAQPTPATPSNQPLQLEQLLLDPIRRQASYAGEALTLTGTEYELLLMLAQHCGEALTKNQISEQVLRRPLAAYDRSIDVHISNLRKKLVAAGAERELIHNIRGLGYQLMLNGEG